MAHSPSLIARPNVTQFADSDSHSPGFCTGHLPVQFCTFVAVEIALRSHRLGKEVIQA